MRSTITDRDAELKARMAWSHIVKPGDGLANELIDSMGAPAALAAVLDPTSGPTSVLLRATSAQLASVATGLVCKVAGATRLAFVVYSDTELAKQINTELSESAAGAGLSIVDALVVTDGRWARIGKGDEPIERESVPQQFAEMASDGDQSSGAALPAADAVLAAEVVKGIESD